ncbi:FCD domain-containing protein [Roseomonas sp. CCTCC AB2023176]|uniref:FCD domain-containing protein n=1 Tax=Roseomonas sp. CCTCC AB2023176 TaxID=3342640 RepID=UPI0035E1EE46
MQDAPPRLFDAARPTGRRADGVADDLARRIGAGELAEGARLPPERDLMRRFGVGRAAVREALHALAARGLIVARPGHRPVVQRPGYEAALTTLGSLVSHLMEDGRGVLDLFETRVLLEAALVRHAALHARRDDVEALEAALAGNHAAIGDPERFYATDAIFHAELYRIPGNPIYPAVHRAYVEWLQLHWQRLPRGADIDRLNHAGHAAILHAILRRDPDAAELALRRHLATALEFLRATFASSPSPGPTATEQVVKA